VLYKRRYSSLCDPMQTAGFLSKKATADARSTRLPSSLYMGNNGELDGTGTPLLIHQAQYLPIFKTPMSCYKCNCCSQRPDYIIEPGEIRQTWTPTEKNQIEGMDNGLSLLCCWCPCTCCLAQPISDQTFKTLSACAPFMGVASTAGRGGCICGAAGLQSILSCLGD
jgi:hypothetical protein